MKTFCQNRRRSMVKHRTAVSGRDSQSRGVTTENEVPVLDSVDGLCRRAIRLHPSETGTFYVVVSGTKQRSLKCEKTGEFFYGKTVPLIRLRGKWLAAAGFPPNSRVQVKILRSGLIQLRKEK
ncbi:MAG TPA: SymE family type I addiction module toxin [Verrucomicrobiae bacterium]|nr:SymE family type I addiction module toxin [Verrucomicrobiae bacterium]